MPNDQADPKMVIAEFLDKRQKSIVVHPNEFLIVVRDGKLEADGSLNDLANWEIIRTQGKHELTEGGLFGAKTTVLGLLGNGSEHKIEFSTPGPQDTNVETVTARDAPILSQDRVIIPLHITMTIAIDQANATKLFRLTSLRTSSRFTVADFREMIRPNIMANVIAPTLALYKAADIRGNETVQGELLAKLQNEFLSYLRWYGIGLSGNQMTVLWGLTAEDIEKMKPQAEPVSEKPSNPSPANNTGIKSVAVLAFITIALVAIVAMVALVSSGDSSGDTTTNTTVENTVEVNVGSPPPPTLTVAVPIPSNTKFSVVIPASTLHNFIAFATKSGESQNIWIMNNDGSNKRKVTDLTESNTAQNPSLSSDASKIAYQASRFNSSWIYSIDMINSDGSGNTTIKTAGSQETVVTPSISPNGATIVYTLTSSGNSDIYSMNIDGTNDVNLTNSSSSNEEAPSSSPDGQKIVFQTSRDGNSEIYVMNVNGSNQTRLTTNGTTETNPVWSPDGTKIAFVTNRDGNWEIYTMDADGSNQVNISNNTAFDSSPSWSRDGTKLTFHSSRDESTGGEIYTMNADGTNIVRLTNNNLYDGEVSWSP